MSQTPIDSQSPNSSTSSSRFHAIHYANQLEPVHGFLGRYMRRRLAAADAELNSPTSSSSFSDLSRVIEWLPKVWHKVNKYLDVLSPSADITIGTSSFACCVRMRCRW
jgi:neuron navigator 2